MTTFDYDNLFADRRVLLFSITNIRTFCSLDQFKSFQDNYLDITACGIDDVCVIDSTDWLVGPWVDKRSDTMKGLPDRDAKFVKALAEHHKYQKETFDLARYWQYVVIINNGEPEKIWHNPFKSTSSLTILKSQAYRYRKLSADVILKYLIDNPK
jgi:peroxiredoxin